MKCYNCPIDHQNPYPDHGADVGFVDYTSDLVLFRPREEFDNRADGPDVYTVGAPMSMTWQGKEGGGDITVPAGFITDLTSVPPLFRIFVSRAGPWLEAAVVHDYLYVAWQDIPDRGSRRADRKFADDVMFAAMTRAGVSGWRKWGIYLAVRLGGGWTYHNTGTLNYVDMTDKRLVYLAGVSKVV